MWRSGLNFSVRRLGRCLHSLRISPAIPSGTPASTPTRLCSLIFPKAPLSWNTSPISHQSLDSGEVRGIDDEVMIFDADAVGGRMMSDVGAAEEVDETVDPEQLESVLSLLQSTADGSLESTLDGMCLALHPQFVIRVLKAPLLVGDNVLRFFRWASHRNSDLEVNALVLEELVCSICLGGGGRTDVRALWDLIKEVREKREDGALDGRAPVLVALVDALPSMGEGKAALEVLDVVEEVGRCVPDDMSEYYYSAVRALFRCSLYDLAWSLCERMLNAGRLPDGHKAGKKIISWFCDGKKDKCAYPVYLAAKDGNSKSPQPQSCINFLVASWCEEDPTVKLGWELPGDFKGEARQFAIEPFSDVIRCLCWIGDFDGARKLFHRMTAEGPALGNAVFYHVISSCSEAEEMRSARVLMQVMKGEGLEPDVYTYTVIIAGYANSGEMDQARKVLLEAKMKHSKPTPVTCYSPIRGCCEIEGFDQALELFSEMKDCGFQPSVDGYNVLIQPLCLKVSDWEKAEKLLEEMEERGLHL
ncbi:uncharacterized protein J3R85_017662 [Psidium guajava]|nr:uncharacterized protein J3R85_017662 [Psidium guajava]